MIIGRYDDNGNIIRVSDGAFVPADPDNRDYAALMAAVVDGAVIEPWEPEPEPVPAEISPSQLFIGLVAAGMITEDEAMAAAKSGTVPPAIDALFSELPASDALAARVRWARMTTVERDNPLVAALGAANGLSDQDIDDAFRAWSKL